MITNAESVVTGEALSCDVCVIGGGAAGITVALELGKIGIQVIVLEAGGVKWDSRCQDLYKGKVSTDPKVAGELMETEGDFPHAADQYQKALEKDPSLAGIRRALGVALMNTSQDDASLLRAQKEFEQELAVNPSDAHSEYQLGEIFWRKRQADEAAKHYLRAIQIRPTFADALIALSRRMGLDV